MLSRASPEGLLGRTGLHGCFVSLQETVLTEFNIRIHKGCLKLASFRVSAQTLGGSNKVHSFIRISVQG